ncbi:DUF3025 domain-containing protein [Paraglaciecola aquimarina]|uniref:DUF3025 domain-containing protein n=1 Tax=Paraglaciecola aquimarina TaxID=1235557 RepID=A0ABU3T052_9ALTE|nr:DUF3025 domain-containing protein [Paraglaciecola aquimarina]MDU0355626.1 DUF3025 domain-containing protein [Paraglaciecola aquimarina]
MAEKWHEAYLNQLSMLPMQQIEAHFQLSKLADWPNADGLNLYRQQSNMVDIVEFPAFVCQSQLAQTDAYYEQIIYQQKLIPTRPNSWHDLFNGLIWLQFPKTKQLLNALHVEDIKAFGLTPRSARRNSITHFDECGVIITYEKSLEDLSSAKQLLAKLTAHQWHEVFVEHRNMWGQGLHTFMFGHANLEMLLQPFIGLTGKWLAVEVPQGFSELCYKQQIAQVDDALHRHIKQQQVFSQKKPLSPIPLLGIPEYWNANKSPSFYQNSDYFRPARQHNRKSIR